MNYVKFNRTPLIKICESSGLIPVAIDRSVLSCSFAVGCKTVTRFLGNRDGTGTCLQHTLDKLVKVDAAAAVGVELQH